MKHIIMTPEIMADMKNKFLEQLDKQFANTRNAGTSIDFKYNIAEIELEDPIILNFTGLAWAKQTALLQNCKTEIAWHGLVRTNEKRTVFQIEDILIYPQTVAGTTVVTDVAKYEAWKAKLDDKAYTMLRYQAHSHVSMPTSPSGTDRNMYDGFLQSLSNESFYIFAIINKRDEWHIEAYDMKNNALYSNNDIVVSVDGVDLDDWYAETFENQITENKVTSTLPAAGYGYHPAAGSIYDDPHGYYDPYDEKYGRHHYDTNITTTKGKNIAGKPAKGGGKP